jgi:hypothetical protein
MRGLLRSFVSLCVLMILCVGLSSTSMYAATVAWEQAAPSNTTTFTAAEASAYRYRVYVNSASSGATLLNVTCAITNLKLVKTCQCALPSAQSISQEDLASVTGELERLIWEKDPVAFIQERCHEFLWSKQREIAQSLVNHRRTAVHSCHETGKSFLAARLTAWWLAVHKPGEAFVVTSAPTGRQVRTILWREIGRIHAKAGLPGRTNQTEWMLEMPAGNEEIVAFGMKPDDMSPTAFQGIHAKYVLVIFDEACGIAPALWDAADSLVANDYSRMLAIGNPDDPETEFCEICKPGSGWNVIGIGYADTPNFTKEKVPDEIRPLLIGPFWVAEKQKKWGEDNPLFISKCLGQFPTTTMDGLIPLKWIRAAQERELKPGLPNELGVDIGGGGDPNIIAHRRGGWVRVIKKDIEPDTMRTTGHIIEALRKTDADCAKIDVIGIGRGVCDRGKELNKPFIPVNVAERPLSRPATRDERRAKKKPDQEFANLKAEGFWNLRTLFQEGQIDIDAEDDDLAAQLAALKYDANSRGETIIINKKELREDINRSPDEAEAVMLAFIKPPTIPKKKHRATWGRRAA